MLSQDPEKCDRQTHRQTDRRTHRAVNFDPRSNKINVFTKFHDDWAKNVTSRVKMHPLPAETNFLTKFHENWANNVTSIVFTCFHYIHIEKTAPPTGGHVFSPILTIYELVRGKLPRPPGSHVFQRTGTIFNLNSHWTKNVTSRAFTYINKTNVLTKFHDDRAKIVTSRVFTRKTFPPTGGHVFQRTGTTFEFNQHIIKTNILTNFELDRGIIRTNILTKHVASRVFTRKTATQTGGHVFQRNGTTFELNQHIITTNILTNFKLDRGIIGTNLLTKFYEDRTRNVASIVSTRKTAPPTGGYVFQRTGTTF
ncbi:hypothetical protein DPMN_101463 [Dreissena polymorpha]|uniref:Uncharacterized protein n=1 Tax=Dreissena polymorpha TaxID=45954 RepID=A0A9D4R947_DREPO|nr:hypothetical protein DPMN_101463 [Dreissena polymorpha]